MSRKFLRDFSEDNMKQTELNGNVFDFSVY